MSFSLDVKEEICKQPLTTPCCIRAEILGILLYCNTFSNQEVRINTSSPSFAARIPLLFETIHIPLSHTPSPSRKFSFTISDTVILKQLLHLLDYDFHTLSRHIQFGLLEDTCCQHAFCRGAFLAGGSVTHPEKQYHLELHTVHNAVHRQFSSVLIESQLEPKLSQRKGRFLCYFKQSVYIQAFLRCIGAKDSAKILENFSQKKNLTSEVNRQVNCDAANLNKTIDAAQSQIKAIRWLDEAGLLVDLPDKLKETAYLRLENPHCTLSELAEFFTPPLSKSALNHRMRKLLSLAHSTKEE